MWRTKDCVRVVDPVAGDDTGADRDVVDPVAFSQDSGTLVTGGWTKGALLRRGGGSWDVIGERLPRDQLSGTSAVFLDQRSSLTDWIPGHVGKAFSAAFSPDGSLPAVGGERGRVLLVDVGSRRAPGPDLTSDTAPVPCVGSPCGPVRDLAFSRDGKHLVSVTNAAHEIWGRTAKGEAGQVVDPSSVMLPGATLWSTDLTAWSRAACVRAGRALTGAEAHRFDTGDPLPCSP
ncbi:WD40 repeat domain-containing protein [Streptomyces mirabilis]|uniref:WD40 repeat domain-containing protein n=1 Tax=Streptomyces mirabilis TaxID=68239 RepID=UPI0033312D2A